MHVCPSITHAIDIALSPCMVLIVSRPTLLSQIVLMLVRTENESRSSSNTAVEAMTIIQLDLLLVMCKVKEKKKGRYAESSFV